jgi:4-hydroxyphenylpyruvate dioxygenase
MVTHRKTIKPRSSVRKLQSNYRENPIGTDGFEFVEYTANNTRKLASLFETLGFVAVARHRSKDVTLYQQGDINFIINHEPDSFAHAFARVHGPSVCAFGIRVKDAAYALKHALAHGAKAHHGRVGPMELNIPAIRGVGGSLIYLVDRYDNPSIYDIDFIRHENAPSSLEGAGLTHIDHLTHNVHSGRMDYWAQFYHRLFHFREIRYFNIRGQKTGLRSRAMVSPCGKIRIPINEPSDRKSQVKEYLEAYHGEGIQHIAIGSKDIYATVEALSKRGIRFLEVPHAYYQNLSKRVPRHEEDVERLKGNRILIDGEPDRGLLLQIFTETVIGPIFFEIIQRKGNEGFGEGNFKALFEAMERDQMARGYLDHE